MIPITMTDRQTHAKTLYKLQTHQITELNNTEFSLTRAKINSKLSNQVPIAKLENVVCQK